MTRKKENVNASQIARASQRVSPKAVVVKSKVRAGIVISNRNARKAVLVKSKLRAGSIMIAL